MRLVSVVLRKDDTFEGRLEFSCLLLLCWICDTRPSHGRDLLAEVASPSSLFVFYFVGREQGTGTGSLVKSSTTSRQQHSLCCG